ncbi:hypothetical protein RchiOBHm_Chr3g0449011 [Rosa chinensis]|uniref:Uncharacterized protein n=1 Tax=Rosa chinensis TaxID=74649 RepID=A0A2P6R5F1_ROSCH|nr:hypothetical protein RchiOBHm_Chr3g0449011 [Rosa chinensis]
MQIKIHAYNNKVGMRSEVSNYTSIRAGLSRFYTFKSRNRNRNREHIIGSGMMFFVSRTDIEPNRPYSGRFLGFSVPRSVRVLFRFFGFRFQVRFGSTNGSSVFSYRKTVFQPFLVCSFQFS